MKRITVIIVAVVLCIALAGYVGATYLGSGILQTVTNKENDIPKENSNAEQNAEVTANEDMLSNNQETVIEPLSEQDKTVKEEIAKFVTTDVDFRYEKQETIDNKQINLTFSELEVIDNIGTMITYTNDNGDEAMYYSKNGKLFLARLNYEIVNENLDVDTAQQKADDFVFNLYKNEDLTLISRKEYNNYYSFTYSKFFSGYRSDASYSIEIDKNGNIIYLRDAVDFFDGVEVNVDPAKIEQLKAKALERYASEGAEIKSTYITHRNGELQLEINVSYGTKPDGTIGGHGVCMVYFL